MKTTPWFPASVKPFHVGVYEVKGDLILGKNGAYSLWDGTEFKSVAPTAGKAAKCKTRSFWMTYSTSEWRGLSKNPYQISKGVKS